MDLNGPELYSATGLCRWTLLCIPIALHMLQAVRTMLQAITSYISSTMPVTPCNMPS